MKHCDYFDDKFKCHHDPIVMEEDGSRYLTLGQVGSALGHLTKQNIKKGDIFLFYGLFREIELHSGMWRYKPSSKNFHLIFSYMKIDEIIKVKDNNLDKTYKFLSEHPHLDSEFRKKYRDNSIYIGKEFKLFKYDEKRVLSDIENYKGASLWRLPINFDFSEYFSYIKIIDINDGYAYLKHIGPGQEFVLNIDEMTKEQKKCIFDYLEMLEVLQ